MLVNKKIFYNLILCSILLNGLFGSVLKLQQMKNTDEQQTLTNSFLLQLKDLFRAKYFVETGTFLGGTTMHAADVFNSVYTIELSEALHKKALRNFKHYNNIKAYCGDSGQILPQVIHNIESQINESNDLNFSVIFFLDAHFSGFPTALGSINTPIKSELNLLLRSSIENLVILIDDLRCFDTNASNIQSDACLRGYPDVNELVDLILKARSNYKIVVFGDSLLAYPEKYKISWSPVVSACTKYRLSNKNDRFSDQSSKKTIAEAKGQEKIAIEDLYNRFWKKLPESYKKYGVSRHYLEWYNLIQNR